jgi:hypothetical protein
MREQLQRSISVREQQRHIIESRLQKTAKGEGPNDGPKPSESNPFGNGLKTAGLSKKRGPPGLSIVAPDSQRFASERVIQSAPLHQSFTGGRFQHPATRQIENRPSNLSNTSHIHHVPANQTQNRLPPITDVFAQERLSAHRDGQQPSGLGSNSASNSSHSNVRQPFPSPGLPSSHQVPPQSAGQQRPREYRSAEEAVQSMSGGREDLLPKIVHYGGHQPPTPPSPLNANGSRFAGQSAGSRKRARLDWEGPEATSPPHTARRAANGPFGEERDTPESQRRKKERFMSLCAEAWDLFHS